MLRAGAGRLVPRGNESQPMSITETAVQWAATMLLSRSFCLALQDQVHISVIAVIDCSLCFPNFLHGSFVSAALLQTSLCNVFTEVAGRGDSSTRPMGRYAES